MKLWPLSCHSGKRSVAEETGLNTGRTDRDRRYHIAQFRAWRIPISEYRHELGQTLFINKLGINSLTYETQIKAVSIMSILIPNNDLVQLNEKAQ